MEKISFTTIGTLRRKDLWVTKIIFVDLVIKTNVYIKTFGIIIDI